MSRPFSSLVFSSTESDLQRLEGLLLPLLKSTGDGRSRTKAKLNKDKFLCRPWFARTSGWRAETDCLEDEQQSIGPNERLAGFSFSLQSAWLFSSVFPKMSRPPSETNIYPSTYPIHWVRLRDVRGMEPHSLPSPPFCLASLGLALTVCLSREPTRNKDHKESMGGITIL